MTPSEREAFDALVKAGETLLDESKPINYSDRYSIDPCEIVALVEALEKAREVQGK